VIWLLIDSVLMCLFLSHHQLLSPVAVEAADQKHDYDDLKKILLHLLVNLFQIVALLILNQYFLLLILNLPIFKIHQKKTSLFLQNISSNNIRLVLTSKFNAWLNLQWVWLNHDFVKTTLPSFNMWFCQTYCRYFIELK